MRGAAPQPAAPRFFRGHFLEGAATAINPKTLTYAVSGLCLGAGVPMLFWRPRPNWWIGVRLPWTFADPRIWRKAWGLSSRILVIMGVNALWSWRAFFITFAHFVVLSYLYPILLYRLKYGTLRYWKDMGWLEYYPVVRCRHCGQWQKLPREPALATAICQNCGLVCRSKKEK